MPEVPAPVEKLRCRDGINDRARDAATFDQPGAIENLQVFRRGRLLHSKGTCELSDRLIST